MQSYIRVVVATFIFVFYFIGHSYAHDLSKSKAGEPGILFAEKLQDIPGMNLVVVDLKWEPTKKPGRVDHYHPGSVWVYVTEGVLRMGVEGQPIQELKAGESFFEPIGELHTVAESASTTEFASAIAVMLVPEGEPLVIPKEENEAGNK